MNVTRNTRLYKATSENGIEVIYRTLTVNELTLLDKINSIFHKNEMAYNIAVINPPADINFFEIQQIGKDAIDISLSLMMNDELFEITLDDLRMSVKSDPILTIISNIIGTLPNTSIEYLLSLTYEDLVELGAFCEELTNKKIFQTKRSSVKNTEQKGEKNFFQDDGKTLQQKMKEIKDF